MSRKAVVLWPWGWGSDRSWGIYWSSPLFCFCGLLTGDHCWRRALRVQRTVPLIWMINSNLLFASFLNLLAVSCASHSHRCTACRTSKDSITLLNLPNQIPRHCIVVTMKSYFFFIFHLIAVWEVLGPGVRFTSIPSIPEPTQAPGLVELAQANHIHERLDWDYGVYAPKESLGKG